jgi:hypothetical protein
MMFYNTELHLAGRNFLASFIGRIHYFYLLYVIMD